MPPGAQRVIDPSSATVGPNTPVTPCTVVYRSSLIPSLWLDGSAWEPVVGAVEALGHHAVPLTWARATGQLRHVR